MRVRKQLPNLDRQKTGRIIQAPRSKLDVIQKRIAALLMRIKTPSYLHSTVKGRSYITNAKRHSVQDACVKIDIERFYLSVRAQAVYHFFLDRMNCAGDVAGILTKLLTVDSHMPIGSSSSPIVAYFAYEDMFRELADLGSNCGCLMTLYGDDVTFSGAGATRNLLYQSRQIIGRYRLRTHKTKLFHAGEPRVITGAAVTKVGLKLPNQRKRVIAADKVEFEAMSDGHGRLKVARRFAGRLAEASQIDPTWRRRAKLMAANCRTLARYDRRDEVPTAEASS